MIQSPRMISDEATGYAQKLFHRTPAPHISAHASARRAIHRIEKSDRGYESLRRSRNRPIALENVNANELASAMPFIRIGRTRAAENANVPATLAAVIVIACFGRERANSARMTTVEQAMPGSPRAE